MDVCKDESITSMSQLQSCINNLLVMQKVFVEKLGVEMRVEGNIVATTSMQQLNEHNNTRPLVTSVIVERFGDVMDGMQKDQVVIMTATSNIGKVDVKDTTNVVAKSVAHEQVGCSIVGELCGGNPITS